MSIASSATGCASATKNASTRATMLIVNPTVSRRDRAERRSATMSTGIASVRMASAPKWLSSAERSGIHCTASMA
ncbi:MAG: hypothetical protein ACYTED_13590 [Planctomycetota bacterium]